MSGWQELWRKEPGREILHWTEKIMNMHDGRREDDLICPTVMKNAAAHPSPSACAPDPSLSDQGLLRQRGKRSSSPQESACQQVSIVMHERHCAWREGLAIS